MNVCSLNRGCGSALTPPAAVPLLPPSRPTRLLGHVIDVLPWVVALAFAVGLLAGN